MLAQKYMEAVEKATASVTGCSDTIRKAADMVVEAINQGKKVYVTDRYGIVESELAEKPGNLALFRSLQRSPERLAEGDILILSSFAPRDERDLEILSQAKALGAKVITICPSGQLSEKADLAFSEPGTDLNSVLTAPGLDTPFGPVSGIVHVLLLNLIQANTAELLLASKKLPVVLPGEYLAGGKEMRATAQKTFTSRGY